MFKVIHDGVRQVFNIGYYVKDKWQQTGFTNDYHKAFEECRRLNSAEPTAAELLIMNEQKKG